MLWSLKNLIMISLLALRRIGTSNLNVNKRSFNFKYLENDHFKPFLFTTITCIGFATAGNITGLQASYDCACPGDNVLYECTVSGDGVTVWRGGAFDCPEANNMISLLHGIDSTRECNNGEIVGRLTHTALENEHLYTSQLMVTVGPDTNGSAIECLHDDATGNITEVGSTVLTRTTSVSYNMAF